MKRLICPLVAGSTMFAVSMDVFAWAQPTHKNIVMDALTYMGSDKATTEQKRAYDFYVKAAGGNVAKAADALGQACYDVDDFRDVHLGAWWMGYWDSPLFGLTHSIVGFNAYHHFINMTRGQDAHGNPHGGYDFRYRVKNGSLGGGEFFDIDVLASVYLWNQELWKNDYDSTEAHYRQGSYSNWNDQYGDFQTIPWQPSANAAKYWFEEFKKQPTFQSVGYALHFVTDAGQPHHTMSTSANNHAGWEGWVDDNYKGKVLADFVKVQGEVGKFNARDSVQNLVTQAAAFAYSHPEVLYSTDAGSRENAARLLIPESIATTVTVLTKAVNCVNQQCGL